MLRGMMRWAPLLAAACTLAPLACGFTEDSSSASASASQGQSGGDSEDTTLPTTGDSDGAPELPPGFWPGVACQPPEEEEAGTPRVYFDLRAGKEDGQDYFRLPFPNDVRLVDGGLDLEGFPSPPPDLDPAFGAVVGRWLAHLGEDTAGFAVNGAVLFRSTHGISAAKGIYYINITPGHPEYGQKIAGLSFNAQNGAVSRNNYICRNWLAVETIDGIPLRPDATYAVLLTDEVKPAGADRFQPDADFAAMLAESAPSGAAGLAAWQRYAPLREFLASAANTGPEGPQLSRADLIGGTVFTTAPNQAPLAGARDAVRQSPLVVHDLHLCTAAGDSPCSTAAGLTDDERAGRRCGAPSPDYHEIHGRIRLPVFQEGQPPYAAIGGRIDVEDGAPVLRSSVDACFALTIPKQASMPEAGWPALLYAHGTGGGFRSAIGEGLASRLAGEGVATIALEGVVHGERRGDTDDDGLVDGLDQEQLVFNVFNPESARDTIVQAAIDQFSAVRLAEQWTDATLLEGQEIRFDPAGLAFMGHSQGANAGALFLGFEPLVRAAVLSGGGAHLVRALLGKSEPKVENPVTGVLMPPRELLQLAFQERPDQPLTSAHPMLQLLNTYVNRSDADNTSGLLRRDPPEGAAAKHLLVYIGHVDSYTPLRAAGSLAIGAGVALAGKALFPGPCDQYEGDERSACGWTSTGWLPTTDLPATGNSSGVTAVARMLAAPAGEDGHYVAFEPAELARITTFVAGAAKGETPTVP